MDEKKLEALNPALNAHYRSGKEHMCLEETRTELLETISDFLHLLDNLPVGKRNMPLRSLPKLFWLFGLAGSGKSSVANTVAADVEQAHDFDLTCFFCKRDDTNLNDPKRFFPTLAYRISRYYPSYKSALADLLCSPEGAGLLTWDTEKQYRMLLGNLLPDKAEPARRHVVVIDALDECGGPADQKIIAECVLSLTNDAPWISAFVTSRPEPKVCDVFSQPNSNCAMSNINDEHETSADIRRFIEAKLEQLELKTRVLNVDIDKLVEQAAGLFIWCSTLFKHIGSGERKLKVLKRFLSGSKLEDPLKQLYTLYDQVLSSAANPEHPEDVKALHVFLGIVYVAADNRPLSTDALYQFLHNDTEFVDEELDDTISTKKSLHAVLFEDSSMSGALRVHHPSFLDYIRARLDDGKFTRNLQEIHQLMFKGCFAILDEKLEFNICRLEDGSLLNKDVPDLEARVKRFIPEYLQYGLLFWFRHLSVSGLRPEDVHATVSTFLNKKALFWIEAMCLLKKVNEAAAIFRECAQFFMVSLTDWRLIFSNEKSQGVPDISTLAYEWERFVQSCPEVLASVPHIYLSALPWVPEQSQIQKTVAASLFKHLPLITNKELVWGGTKWEKRTESSVGCIAYSADGRHVAAGLWNGVPLILDAGTGDAVVEPLQGHSESVGAVAFFSDSRWIASGSWDKSMRIWNVQSGAVEKVLEGHTDVAYSVAFSKDDKYVASSSDDKTVRIWDWRTGTETIKLEGHKNCVNSVVFCPDGKHLISASDDRTIRIWNIDTGVAAGELLGHEGTVRSVAVSFDGRLVASGSWDRTVRIWDFHARTGIGNPLHGHTSDVNSVAFSPTSPSSFLALTTERYGFGTSRRAQRSANSSVLARRTEHFVWFWLLLWRHCADVGRAARHRHRRAASNQNTQRPCCSVLTVWKAYCVWVMGLHCACLGCIHKCGGWRAT